MCHRRIVEHLTDPSGLRGFLNKIAKTLGGWFQILKEETIYGCVARRKLCWMQVPSLVKAGLERPADVVEMKLPGTMDGRDFLPSVEGSD